MNSDSLSHRLVAWVRRRLASTVSLSLLLVVGCERHQVANHPDDQSKQSIDSKMDLQSTVQIPKSPEQPNGSQSKSTIESHTLHLKIHVTGFHENNGTCRIAVYLGPNHFNDPEFAIAKESIEIHDAMAKVIVPVAIPSNNEADAGSVRIAVSAYYDQNGNSTLDKNSFGIPTERYGFSRNPKRGFGPPKFNEVAIETKTRLLLNEPLEVPITIQ